MKKNQINLVVVGVVFSFLLCQNVRAAIVRSSQLVGYNTGLLGANPGTGTLDGWGNSTAQVTVTNGSGSLDGAGLGLVASAGDKAFISAIGATNARNQFATNTTFPQTIETNLYYSFLYKFKNAGDVSGDGETLIRVNRANSGTGTAQHWDLVAKNVGGQMQIGISKAGAPNNTTNYATTNLSVGQTFFVVVRQHIIPGVQNDVYDLWINPPAETFGTNELSIPPSSATIGALATDGTEDASNTGPGRFVVAAGVNAEFDEFRVATTWAEATPFFGQCIGAGIATSPASRTNSAELATTFIVYELGTSPTFQWQLSTNAGSTFNHIGGATASTYTTPNLPLSANGNQYRALVNVACDGSSATSAVATVTLTVPVETSVGIVMDDTFLDPELGFDDRSNLPLTSSNSVWYTAVTDNLAAFQQGGNMVGIPLAASSSLWLGYFIETNEAPVHLGVGKTLKVTLPFTPSSYNAFTANSGLRIGIFDYADGGTRLAGDSAAAGGSAGNGTGVRGYMLNLDFGPTFSANSPLQLLVRNFLPDSNLMGSIADYESFGSGPAGGGYSNAPAFQAGTQYVLVFTVARTAENSVTVQTTITGGGTNWSHSITDTNYAYHRFDAFGIRVNSLETSADSFTFPEFKVEILQGSVSVAPFHITHVQLIAPDAVRLAWDSETGATYHVLSTDSLAPINWVTNATIVATGSSSVYTNSPIPGSVSQRYYQIVAPPFTP